ncbi:50S ribosomal protein L25 [Patescibacteria group bacterium]|nr:50S ribosomal protein L25 [Patescibacteria group bacterium]MBU4601031.1 50S ribosomal protein L25 [Patescibacteria group bacterium]MCG2698730.1 50S ribosomal protein L25 [Candidatus Parcubacteria bacterium]
MNEIKLSAESRDKKNGSAKQVLSTGYIPAVIYGSGAKNINLKIKKNDFERVFAAAGESNLIDLIISGKQAVKVIVKDFQENAVKGGVTHIDFYQVDMKKKITTNIPLDFIGKSKAVKELGGILIKNMDEVEVECLPGNLVNKIEVDLSKLNDLSDIIRVSDLSLPEGISIINEQSDVVASVVELRAAVEEKPQEEKAVDEKAEAAEEAKEGEKKDEADKKEVKKEKK